MILTRRGENGKMNTDLYELMYRNYTNYENNRPATNITISKNTVTSILNDLKEDFKHVKSVKRHKKRFSDVICNTVPAIDENTHNLSYRYEYMFNDGDNNRNINEYIEKFKTFDINTLPLIEVAKYLKIKVEKSNIIEPYGIFRPQENLIILCSDYAPVFIHELAHAIDHILGNSFKEYHLEQVRNFDECVAELSTVLLCRNFNISIDLSDSLYYLDCYSNLSINMDDLLKRAALISEYVNRCVELI
jgi:hypothetical protein